MVTQNWRILTPKMVRKLPTEQRRIVYKGQFIQGRFKMPELVFRVERNGMHLSTYDRVGNAWLRKRAPLQPWTVYVTLET